MKLYLVSGWATTKMVWEPVIDKLKGRLKIEYVDWREAVDGKLGRKIDRSPDRCIVAGWSMGGQIALMEAAENPDKLAGLFLVSSMTCLVRGEGRPGVRKEVPGRIRVMLKRNRRAYLRTFFSRCLYPLKQTQMTVKLLEESDSISTDSLLSGLTYMTDSVAGLSSGIPLMLIHGRNDDIIPWECSDYVCRHSLNSREAYIDNAGHLLPLVEPEAVGNLLDEFHEYCIS